MTIERDKRIQFHERGTLEATTRWISQHDEGLAEWLKNARRAYQVDRADVRKEHQEAVLLMTDAGDTEPARIGLLDVGGASLDDVEAWSVWQDPEASSRGSRLEEEETQGNGGKAYMYRLFRGPARILGVRERLRNCKGFEGKVGSVERGTPGFMPNVAGGREVSVDSVRAELSEAIRPYGMDLKDLPRMFLDAIDERRAFTLVEGVDPRSLYRRRFEPEQLLAKTLRHDQSALAVQQMRLYAVHNGRILNGGRHFQLTPIEPFPEVEGPFVYEIPDQVELPDGGEISTTEDGKKPSGRLTLHTSKDDMYRGYKSLRPRWKISYWTTGFHNIGSKPVPEFVVGAPGYQHVYGEIELPALEPGYVAHGRQRPKPGPLMEAVDAFTAERIREVSRLINERKKKDLDDRALDEVQKENAMLDQFKNKFLPLGQGSGGKQDGDDGDSSEPPDRDPVDYGTDPDLIELTVPTEGLIVACGVSVHLRSALEARVLDSDGKPVRASLEWHSSNENVVRIERGDRMVARHKGTADVWATAKVGRAHIESERVTVAAWVVDHVLLVPRSIEVEEGGRASITAEVTSDLGQRSTNVFLHWDHDSDDPLTVLIGPRGVVTGNRVGRTSVSAGAPASGAAPEVWSRIPVSVQVTRREEPRERGGGFPRLLVVGRDVDPATDEIRQGDPEAPSLWQEAADFANNVWWLNVESPDAYLAFSRRDRNLELWRHYHSTILTEMVVQVHMQMEYSRKGQDERPDYWAGHKQGLDFFRVTVVQDMWRELEPFIREGHEVA